MTHLERFDACMEYRPCDQRPNHELGAWPQTRTRWSRENPDAIENFTWSWFYSKDALGLDRREFIPMNFGFIPPFKAEVLENTPKYEVVRNGKGIVTKALKEGTDSGGRMCMDQYLEFPVSKPEDFSGIKKRLVAAIPERYRILANSATDLDERIAT